MRARSSSVNAVDASECSRFRACGLWPARGAAEPENILFDAPDVDQLIRPISAPREPRKLPNKQFQTPNSRVSGACTSPATRDVAERAAAPHLSPLLSRKARDWKSHHRSRAYTVLGHGGEGPDGGGPGPCGKAGAERGHLRHGRDAHRAPTTTSPRCTGAWGARPETF